MQRKSSPEELREQFNRDVERFVNLEMGQTSTMDSKLAIDLIEKSIGALNPGALSMCDIGCGGGNFALRVLRQFPSIKVSLIDLSPNMLERAAQRIRDLQGNVVSITEGDIRSIELKESSFDIITAAAVLHHLRSREEWKNVMEKIYRSLKSGGTFWMWDLVRYEEKNLQAIQYERFSEYLLKQGGQEYQRMILERIDQSDTPESTAFIQRLLWQIGFREVDILHKNAVFAALYARK